MTTLAGLKNQPKTPIYDKRGFVPSVLSLLERINLNSYAGWRGSGHTKKKRYLIISNSLHHPIYRPYIAIGLKRKRGVL